MVMTSRTSGQALTARQKAELMSLSRVKDLEVDTSDLPELSLSAWRAAVRGRFYRPVKRSVSIRLDADVIAWLKKPGKGYQTRVNQILRKQMLAESRPG